MAKELDFYDKTILSTPNPIHSSSMTAQPRRRISMNLDDIPTRLSDAENSLGLLSIQSSDCIFPTSNQSEAAMQLQKAREKAMKSINKFESKHTPLTAIPSPFLRRSDVSEGSTVGAHLHSESTISESDLLPANTSTPRGSLFDDALVMRDRKSIGKTIGSLANTVMDPNFDLGNVGCTVTKTLDSSDLSFRSGSAAIAKLEQDEVSWQQQRTLPIVSKEFSIESTKEFKYSMGRFFKERSDDLPQIFAKSPKKSNIPLPLIEVSSCSQKSNLTENSLDLSDIQHILSSDQSTTKALDELLLKTKKAAAQSKSPTRKSDILEKIEEDELSEAVKENISPEFHQKSILSSRSSSSLSSLPSGKLPIATTKTEIIWGCIKPGKSNTQEFIIRNRSSGRLGIQCSMSNPSFRLNKEELNSTSSMKVVLHPYESRTLTVTFFPTTTGAAVDSLNFTSMDPNHKQSVKQFIRLYGYGGYGSLSIHNIVKDTTGKFLLSLGNIDEQQDLSRNFLIKNNGSLAIFTYFNFILSGLQSFSSIEISPKVAVLLPGEEREVLVTYTLQKRDFAFLKSKINSCVIDIGKLQVIHGTEVDRARLRKICQKAIEKKQEVNPYVLELIERFPGEVVLNDLKHFKETLSSMEDILRLINNEEITLILEQEIDHTLVAQLSDETAMFHSLLENTASDTFDNTLLKESCHIEPTRIILTPPDKMRDRIFLSNNNKKTVYFEVNVAPEGLIVKPRDGTIHPGGTLIIELQYTKKCDDKTVFKVRVLVDNESFDVDVKVVFVGRN